jgi:hypothetical protein
LRRVLPAAAQAVKYFSLISNHIICSRETHLRSPCKSPIDPPQSQFISIEIATGQYFLALSGNAIHAHKNHLAIYSRFFALNMIMGELHEQAHITTGYLICGCYGPRDFSIWNTCDQCEHPSVAFLATLAGPLFSCLLMWLGAFLFCKSRDVVKQSFVFLCFSQSSFCKNFYSVSQEG